MNSLSDIVVRGIVPRLLQGIESGDGLHLESEDCKALLFVLKTSVSLEPFLNLFSEIIKKTIILGDYNEKTTSKKEDEKVAASYDPGSAIDNQGVQNNGRGD